MVLNTQSYMWMGWVGWVGIGYLLGPTLRAPYGANKVDKKDQMKMKMAPTSK